MTGEVNFWDGQVWSFAITLSILFGALMLANMLRRALPFLRKTLIPSSVLGGFLVLIADYFYKKYFGSSMFNIVTLEALTYHGLGLGVVAMGLRNSDKIKRTRKARAEIFDSGLTTVTTYLLQAVLGLGITIGLYYIIGCFMPAGILLPMGYGQGPGQAYNWGLTYMTTNGFEHGSSFGLSVAAFGFISASIFGVIRLNHIRRKGLVKNISNAEEIEDLSAEAVTAKGEIPLCESLDKLTVQFALIFIGYAMTYAFMWALTKYVLDPAGGLLQNTVKPLIWGFNFLFGMIFAMLLKGILKGGRKIGLIHREYCNNFLLNRISGLMFDIMVIASIASIDLSAFQYKEFLIPLLSVCIVGAIASYIYIDIVCRKLFPDYKHEQFLSFYGMLTGTLSTGFIFLREVDPTYETPAADNLVKQQLWAVLFGAPMLLMMGYVATDLPNTAYITLAALAGMLILMWILLFRRQIFGKKSKAQPASETESVSEAASDAEPEA